MNENTHVEQRQRKVSLVDVLKNNRLKNAVSLMLLALLITACGSSEVSANQPILTSPNEGQTTTSLVTPLAQEIPIKPPTEELQISPTPHMDIPQNPEMATPQPPSPEPTVEQITTPSWAIQFGGTVQSALNNPLLFSTPLENGSIFAGQHNAAEYDVVQVGENQRNNSCGPATLTALIRLMYYEKFGVLPPGQTIGKTIQMIDPFLFADTDGKQYPMRNANGTMYPLALDAAMKYLGEQSPLGALYTTQLLTDKLASPITESGLMSHEGIAFLIDYGNEHVFPKGGVLIVAGKAHGWLHFFMISGAQNIKDAEGKLLDVDATIIDSYGNAQKGSLFDFLDDVTLKEGIQRAPITTIWSATPIQ